MVAKAEPSLNPGTIFHFCHLSSGESFYFKIILFLKNLFRCFSILKQKKISSRKIVLCSTDKLVETGQNQSF